MAGNVDLAKLVVKMEAQSAQYLKDLDKQRAATKKWQSKVSGNVNNVAKSFKGLAAAAGIAVLTKKIIENTKKQEQAVAQLRAGYKSMGGVQGQTVDGMIKKAGELQKVSIFGDEQIIEAQGQMVTFGNIAGEQFDRATVAAMDLSTRMGTDLKSSVLQLGKALNDPVLGLTALTRSGVTFSESQKDMVKAMVASGDTIGAQKFMLDELEKQFGGSAKAARETFGGALSGLSGAFNDLLEGKAGGGGLSEARIEIEKLTTMLQDPAFVENTGRFLSASITGFTKLAGLVGKVAEGWGKIYDWTKAGAAMHSEKAADNEFEAKRKRLSGLIKERNKTPFAWAKKDLEEKIIALSAEVEAGQNARKSPAASIVAPAAVTVPAALTKIPVKTPESKFSAAEQAAWTAQLSYEQADAKMTHDQEQSDWELKLYQEQLDAKLQYDKDYADKTKDVESGIHDMKIGFASAALGLIAETAKEGSTIQKVAMIASKAMAVAQILMQTEVAAISALALPPIGLGPIAGLGMAATIRTMGYASAALVGAQAIASFEGGGYTGDGPRSGGMDGKGGMMAMVHPQESIVDHAKGQGMGGVTVNLIEDAANAGKVTKTETDEGTRIDIAVATLLDRGNNRTTRALEQRYPSNRRQGS